METDYLKTLREEFIAWETLGRGTMLSPVPIDIRPRCSPFVFSSKRRQHFDDARHETLLQELKKVFIKSSIDDAPKNQVVLKPFSTDYPLCTIEISFTRESKIKLSEMEDLTGMLTLSEFPISFEIIATNKNITFQFNCSEKDRDFIYAQLQGFLSSCNIKIKERMDDLIIGTIDHTSIIDFGLEHEFMRSCSIIQNLDIDPFVGLIGILDSLNVDERVIIQTLFTYVSPSWTSVIQNAVTTYTGESIYKHIDLVSFAKQKTSSKLYAATIRAAVQSNTAKSTNELLKLVRGSFIHISSSQHNSLKPLSDPMYEFDKRISDMNLRQSHRLGMLLNSKELITFIHLPVSISSTKFNRNLKKSKPLPSLAQGHALQLGIHNHNNIQSIASIGQTERTSHMHVLGSSGFGKSHFLTSMILQDINRGAGVLVVDPHSDLVTNIISLLPEHRKEDVIIIDLADEEHPVAFNILTAHSEIEKNVLASDLTVAFKRQSVGWGDQMNAIFANAILAFLENSEAGTLADLRRFLIEKKFREKILETIIDPHILYYWRNEFPLIKNGATTPILTRIDSFLRPKIIRNMISQKQSLDFEMILDTNKIVLCKLNPGIIGAENSYLMGSFIITKFQQATMARQAKAKELRNPFYVYIDECHLYLTHSIGLLLSAGRKFGVSLTLAHQSIFQILKEENLIANEIIANASTKVCFKVGDHDAKKLSESFSYYDSSDLQNLNVGEAIAKIGLQSNDFLFKSFSLPTYDSSKDLTKEIITLSREKYSSPKEIIEQAIAADLFPTWEVNKHTLPNINNQNEKPIEIVQTLPKQTVDTDTFSSLHKKNTDKTEKKIQTQHRYLQTLIKRIAESKGYKSTIEYQTNDGNGRIDIVIEKDSKKIAIELCCTTPHEWEIHNLQKCFNDGFVTIISCSTESKTLEGIKKKAKESFTEEQLSNVHFFQPDELFLFLDKIQASELSVDTKIKGYTVKVEYDAIADSAMKRKRDSVGRAVLDSMRKVKKK